MMSILSALLVFLLATVALWFFWPMIADPVARRLARRSETDRMADHLFQAWSNQGQDARVLIRAERH